MSDNRSSWVLRATVVLGTLLAAGCTATTTATTTTSTTTTGGPTASTPGVTATEIEIGAVTTRTGPLAGYFDGLAPGMIAYFDMIDAKGGIDGRKLVLADNLDDGGVPTQFTQDVHTLIDQDHVFAVGVASPWFTPNYFVSTKTPTYGYNVSGNWQGPLNLFAAGGSVQDYAAGVPTVAYFVKKLNLKSVAFISYGQVIASSYDACTTQAHDLKAAGYNVSLVDVSAGLNGSFSSDVQRMRQAGADAVVSCMQASDNVTLARDIQQYNLKITQLWYNGYDQQLLNQYKGLMQGVYLNNTGSVPFEAANTARYGNTYQGMQQYIAAMNKYEPSYTYNGVAFQGWQSAVLLAAGIQAAGKDLTQAGVIAATNKMKDFNAGGLSAPVDWTVTHTGNTLPNCTSWVQVQGDQYVPVLAPGRQVFVCVGANASDPVPVPPPPGTPGA